MNLWAGSTVCLSFLRELFEGVHDFRTDVFRLALYGSDAILGKHTASYTTLGEILPLNGYATAGKAVVVDLPLISDESAVVPIESLVWTPASFRARGALLYNASKPGMPSVFVLDFGAMREANGNNFTVQFPASTLRLQP